MRCIASVCSITWRRPWRLLDEFASVASAVFLQTHYARDATTFSEGVPGVWCGEFGARDPLSGLSPSSFWMTRPAIVERPRAAGFPVEPLEEVLDHPNGPLITLAARR